MARKDPQNFDPPDLESFVQDIIDQLGDGRDPGEVLDAVVSRGILGGPELGQRVIPEPLDLRKTPPGSPLLLTIRAEIEHSKPPIWRRVNVRSDLTLADLHEVLQIVFGWWDAHLHRFSAGGGPFDDHAQHFLCPFDVAEGDRGIPAHEVTVGELLQAEGDQLQYLYDYGDHWDVSLKVQHVEAAAEEAPAAVVTAGRRAAPPEDCGSLRTAEELSEVLEDPAAFDLDAINEALTSGATIGGRIDIDVHPALEEVRRRLAGTWAGIDVEQRIGAAAAEYQPPDEDELRTALAPVMWFLERSRDGGLELTGAGYLKPDIVAEANFVVPSQQDNWGANNRESQSPGLAAFRRALQKVKLLRKYKGTLLPTRAAVAAGDDPWQIAAIIAGNLVPKTPEFEREAAVLSLLAFASTPPGFPLELEDVMDTLGVLGWSDEEGRTLWPYHVAHLPVVALLRNLTEVSDEYRRGIQVTPTARVIAATALGLVADG